VADVIVASLPGREKYPTKLKDMGGGWWAEQVYVVGGGTSDGSETPVVSGTEYGQFRLKTMGPIATNQLLKLINVVGKQSLYMTCTVAGSGWFVELLGTIDGVTWNVIQGVPAYPQGSNVNVLANGVLLTAGVTYSYDISPFRQVQFIVYSKSSAGATGTFSCGYTLLDTPLPTNLTEDQSAVLNLNAIGGITSGYGWYGPCKLEGLNITNMSNSQVFFNVFNFFGTPVPGTANPFIALPLAAGANINQVYKSPRLSGLGYNVTTMPNFKLATTGALTTGNPNITGVANTTGLLVGHAISGTGIPNNTTIASISGTTVTMSANATATNSSAALGFTSPAAPVGSVVGFMSATYGGS
jgi:hypothetical protein